MSRHKIQLPMPERFPKTFKAVEKELEESVSTLSKFREEHPNVFPKFFDEVEAQYLEILSLNGEEKIIRQTMLMLVFAQMMTLIQHKGENL